MIKRSRQRDAIRQCLIGRYDHPTAETVYMSIKDAFPNISLGTVYRNLSLLSDLGEIQKITVSGGPDRFDGNPAPHYHFSCRKCGCVMDLDMKPQDNLNTVAAEKFPGVIESHAILFTGICPECAKKQKNK
ncbi:MAG: transcriptional repressor [Lachnospiraceae bacterium]|nr:transcriptional repressor [Lachnospiraceae bacterium]